MNQLYSLIVIGVLSGAGVAARAGSKELTPVPVCIANISHVRSVTETLSFTSLVFERVGARIVWHREFVGCNAGSIRIQLKEYTPAYAYPGAMAYAKPYAGFQVFTSGRESTAHPENVHVEVFYDRIEKMGARLAPRLFAYVLIHEITHILQGQTQHAAEGIMKARYTYNDYSVMLQAQLALTRTDVELLRHGIAARAQRVRDEAALLAKQKAVEGDGVEQSTVATRTNWTPVLLSAGDEDAGSAASDPEQTWGYILSQLW